MGGVQSYFRQFQPCIFNIFQQKQLFSLELLSCIYVGAGTMVSARMTSSNKHLNVPPVYHQQKCLINGICRIFYMKSNHFVQLYLKSWKSFENLDKMAIKCKKCVSINWSKTTSLWPNLGTAASSKSQAYFWPDKISDMSENFRKWNTLS